MSCGAFQPHPAHEAALREMPIHVQERMNHLGLNRCLHCWMFRRDHKRHENANVRCWLHKDWVPEDQNIDVVHFSSECFLRLDHYNVPTPNHSDVYEIGSILYDEFSKEDVPVPSCRLINTANRQAIIKCFEEFYNRLFNDAQMQVLFAVGEDGFGRDLGYREHGRRLGLFCLWRLCGDKEYMRHRSSASATCPYQMDVYHKLAPSHRGAKKVGGITVGTSSAFTITQARRWLGHQWCAFRENAPSEDLCKAVVSWLASIIDLYGPFCDDGLMDEEEALRRATEWSQSLAEEEAAMPSRSANRCPFSGATSGAVCPFSGAVELGSEAQAQLPIIEEDDVEVKRALRLSAAMARQAPPTVSDHEDDELEIVLRESAAMATQPLPPVIDQEDDELERALRESAAMATQPLLPPVIDQEDDELERVLRESAAMTTQPLPPVIDQEDDEFRRVLRESAAAARQPLNFTY